MMSAMEGPGLDLSLDNERCHPHRPPDQTRQRADRNVRLAAHPNHMSIPPDSSEGRNWAMWALFGAALGQSFLGVVGWAMNRLSFGWQDWLFSLSGGIYFGLGFAAGWMPRRASLAGAGLYAVFLAVQVLQSVAALKSGLVFKIPIALMLLVAVAAARWWPVVPGKIPTHGLPR